MRYEQLIAEANESTACRCVDAPEQECGRHGDSVSQLIAALADALESRHTATREALIELLRTQGLFSDVHEPIRTKLLEDWAEVILQSGIITEEAEDWEYAIREAGEDEPYTFGYDSFAELWDMYHDAIAADDEIVRCRKAGPWESYTPTEGEN